jgi:hypothetical protein
MVVRGLANMLQGPRVAEMASHHRYRSLYRFCGWEARGWNSTQRKEDYVRLDGLLSRQAHGFVDSKAYRKEVNTPNSTPNKEPYIAFPQSLICRSSDAPHSFTCGRCAP